MAGEAMMRVSVQTDCGHNDGFDAAERAEDLLRPRQPSTARRGVRDCRGPAQAEAARHGMARRRRGRPRPPLRWARAVRRVVGRCCAVEARGGPRAAGRRGGVGRVEAWRVGVTGFPAVARRAVRRGRVAAARRGQRLGVGAAGRWHRPPARTTQGRRPGCGLPGRAPWAWATPRRGRVAAARRGRVAAARKRASGEEATAAWRGEARVEAAWVEA
ncbi:hypothetical protein PVAP13_4NG180933 [Panicum virgatum]|uniref:Uncharacterized protein n=1 Tax=Panicum virgatum TaxID=38727 RepID=A0A8T0TDL1_PANVG|nr:hypothetical protein PVAP13_4NG180933 [Panicum virgatum]